MKSVDFLIIGAGPTGLGAAYQLQKHAISSFLVLEAAESVGGLSSSFRDKQGFSWDVGGHVLFSGNDRFLRLMDDVMGEDLVHHHRKARVRVRAGWTDYPFQDHIHQLDAALARHCREGLSSAPGPGRQTRSFADWIRHSFGSGIAELFMEPYNRKVWACPLQRMSYHWVSERISDAGRQQNGFSETEINHCHGNGWGANRSFRYPRAGGIGAIFHRMAARLDDHLLLQANVVTIDIEKQIVTTCDGQAFQYRVLLSTTPLKSLIKELIRPSSEKIIAAADQLLHNRILIVGVGVNVPGDRETDWMYFPEADLPFYRITHLHNYATDITPKGADRQSALMAEVALAAEDRIDPDRLITETIDGLVSIGLLKRTDLNKIASTWHYHAPFGYPIPTLSRDRALDQIHAYLDKHKVYSRGRFGGWKYEAGNMDHCVMQGVEWADRVVTGAKETVYPMRLNAA